MITRPFFWSNTEKATSVALALVALSLFAHVMTVSLSIPSILNPTVWILLISGLITAAKVVHSDELQKKIRKPKIEDMIVLVFIFWMWISIFTSENFDRSAKLSLQISLLVFGPYFILRLLIRDVADLRLILSVLSFVGAIVGIVTTLLWIIDWDFLVTNTEQNRAMFFSANPIPTATVLFVGTSATAGLMVIKGRQPEISDFALLAAATLPLFITGTRGSFLAALLLVVFSVVVLGRHKFYRLAITISVVSTLLLGSMVIIGATLSSILMNTNVEDPDNRWPRQYFFPTITRISHPLLGVTSGSQPFDQSVSERLSSWTGTIDTIISPTATQSAVETPEATATPNVEPPATPAATPPAATPPAATPPATTPPATTPPAATPTGESPPTPAATPDVDSTTATPVATEERSMANKLTRMFTIDRVVGTGKGSTSPPSHNILLEAIIESGYVGFTLIGSFIAIVGIKSLTRLNAGFKPLLFAILSLFIGLLIIKQFSFTMLGNRDLFVISAMLISLIYIEKNRSGETTPATKAIDDTQE